MILRHKKINVKGLGMVEVMLVVLMALSITAMTFYSALAPRRNQRSEINDMDFENLIKSTRRIIENTAVCRTAFKNAAYLPTDLAGVNRAKMSHVVGAVAANQEASQVYAGSLLLLRSGLQVGSLTVTSFSLNRLSNGIGSPTAGRLRYPVELVVTVDFGANAIGPTTFSNASSPLTFTVEVDTTTWEIVDCVC